MIPLRKQKVSSGKGKMSLLAKIIENSAAEP